MTGGKKTEAESFMRQCSKFMQTMRQKAFRFLCCLQIISERSVMEPFPGRKRLFCLCGVVRQKGQRVLPAAECVLEKNTAEEKL